MIVIDGVKYACERCIRGHRASTCNHRDGKLVMIKPKGRPSTQCVHCKEERKMKNSHVACNCSKLHDPSKVGHDAMCDCNITGQCGCCKDYKKKNTSKDDVVSPTATTPGRLGPSILDEPTPGSVYTELQSPLDDNLVDLSAAMMQSESDQSNFALNMPAFAPTASDPAKLDPAAQLDALIAEAAGKEIGSDDEMAGRKLFDDFIASEGQHGDLQSYVKKQTGDDLLAALGMDDAIAAYNEEQHAKESVEMAKMQQKYGY